MDHNPVADDLRWIPGLDLGFHPLGNSPVEYGEAYWNEYKRRDESVTGRTLTQARWGLVDQYAPNLPVVDVGIGGGRFVADAKRDTVRGHDVNVRAISWLQSRGQLWDRCPIEVMTFWDSIEHIEDMAGILRLAENFVFISTPIYPSEAAVRSSKHYKPGEHYWYFTRQGLTSLMQVYGFKLVAMNHMEEDLGREGISTFVFKRDHR